MKYFLTLGFLLTTLIIKAQILGTTDYSPGYKSSGIFDTVGAIILIDNKVKHELQRIEGYAVREWHTWDGGCDPYINPGYKPLPDQWFPTGVFLYHNKKKIKSQIWNYQILKSEFEPIPKPKTIGEGFNFKKKIVIPNQGINFDSVSIIRDSMIKEDCSDTLWNLTTLSGDINGIGASGITITVDTSIWQRKDSFNKHIYNLFSFKTDTAKLIIWIDKKPLKEHKVKLKKIKGYQLMIYDNRKQEFLPEYKFYDEKFREINRNQIVNEKFVNW